MNDRDPSHHRDAEGMNSPALPIDEATRLEALKQYAVLDSPPEREFDELTALVAEICGVPIALVSLVDAHRQWFKSTVGLDATETSREVSFCSHAIRQPGVFIVPDTTVDSRFAANPLVTGEMGIRFYAGAPLISPEGAAMGTLCVIDRVPRTLTAPQLKALEILSRQVMTQFELRRRASELAGRERLLRAIFDSEPECVKLIGRDGKLQLMNRAGLEMLEAASIEQIVGAGLTSFIVPDHRAPFHALTGRVLRGESGTLEFEIVGLKGTRRWLETHAAPLRDESGAVTGLLGITRDVTAARQTAEALRRSEERFKFAALATNDALRDWDIATNEVWWSDGLTRLFGFVPDEIEPGIESWTSRIHPGDRARVVESFHAALGDGQASWTGEYRFLRKDGTVSHVLDRGHIIRGQDGGAQRMIGGMSDLTERVRLEGQLLRAQRMESVGTLAGGIAHDLNNSLGPIIMSIELMKMKFADQDSWELLEIIDSSAQRAADMVRQLLAFARGVEGQRLVVHVSHLIRDILKIADETSLKQIAVRSEVAPDLCVVLGDPTQLHQVFLNLWVNARDAMPNGGTLTISACNIALDTHYAGMNSDAKPGPYLLIQVEDSGIGMTRDVIEKIFDPFFTTKEVGKGTGLGLSTSLAIVKSHGGFIRVESEVGKGTNFKVYLPGQTESSIPGVAPQVEIPRGNGELILVIDDEAAVRRITKRTLEAFGYRVLLAGDGAEAVALYASQGDDVAAVLTDMMMPVMDGPATIQVLRRMNPLLPIIGASGFPDTGPVAQAGSLGIKHFVPKPYTAETLLGILRETLSEAKGD